MFKNRVRARARKGEGQGDFRVTGCIVAQLHRATLKAPAFRNGFEVAATQAKQQLGFEDTTGSRLSVVDTHQTLC